MAHGPWTLGDPLGTLGDPGGPWGDPGGTLGDPFRANVAQVPRLSAKSSLPELARRPPRPRRPPETVSETAAQSPLTTRAGG